MGRVSFRRPVSYAGRQAPERFTGPELLFCIQNGVQTLWEAQRLIREHRLAFLEDSSELSTAECGFYLCRSRYFVRVQIKRELLPAEIRWKIDGSWAYRVQSVDLRRFARTLGI